jgi:hypothetical protein
MKFTASALSLLVLSAPTVAAERDEEGKCGGMVFHGSCNGSNSDPRTRK